MSKHIFNLKPDAEDFRDQHYSAVFEKIKHIPVSVDMEDLMSPVVDQMALGSCVDNAIACGLKEFLMKKCGRWLHLSRLYLYWYARAIEGTTDQDSGSSVRDAMKAAAIWGIAPEADFPYDISTFTDQPTHEADVHAAGHKLARYSRVSDLTTLKMALANNEPVVLGIQVFSSLEGPECAKTGIVTMPDLGEDSVGGHGVLAVGYDDKTQRVKVRNSWGAAWGVRGYFFLPYEFWAAGYVWDMWTGV